MTPKNAVYRLKHIRHPRRQPAATWFTITFSIAVGVLGNAGIARAAEYNVYSPHVVSGENELETRTFFQQDHNDRAVDGTLVNKLAIGRGLTPFWASELYGEWQGEGHQSLHFDSVEWENRFQLIPQGKYWADLGLLTSAEFPVRSGDPNNVKVGPLLEKQIGRTVTTINLFLERQYGPDAENDVNFSYAARIRWLFNPRFEPAIEAYGEAGDIRHSRPADEQRHQIGPAFYGRLQTMGASALKYSAAALVGVNHHSPDVTLVGRLEYEFF